MDWQDFLGGHKQNVYTVHGSPERSGWWPVNLPFWHYSRNWRFDKNQHVSLSNYSMSFTHTIHGANGIFTYQHLLSKSTIHVSKLSQSHGSLIQHTKCMKDVAIHTWIRNGYRLLFTPSGRLFRRCRSSPTSCFMASISSEGSRCLESNGSLAKKFEELNCSIDIPGVWYLTQPMATLLGTNISLDWKAGITHIQWEK